MMVFGIERTQPGSREFGLIAISAMNSTEAMRTEAPWMRRTRAECLQYISLLRKPTCPGRLDGGPRHYFANQSRRKRKNREILSSAGCLVKDALQIETNIPSHMSCQATTHAQLSRINPVLIHVIKLNVPPSCPVTGSHTLWIKMQIS